MNAAFLLVTSALLVGQVADKKAPPTPTPPPAVVSSSCGQGGCSSCQDPCGCDGFGHRLRDKLRGLFNRNSCDSCQPTTCHSHTPMFRSSCEDACAPKWHACRSHTACAPATCSDSCDRGPGFLAKLRERFQRGSACCDGGCSSCGSCSGGVTVPAKSGEKIETPPKKMPIETPKDKAKDTKKPQEVRIESQSAPFAPNVIQVAPSVPSVEIAPAPAPRVEGTRRDPF